MASTANKKNDKMAEGPKADPRVEIVCAHMTYEIATGVFEPGTKLPTVRDAAARWNLDHRVVLKAYKRLEQMKLVRSVPRSGYYVSAGESHDLISRHRFELEAMFDRVSAEISKTTSLSILGAFRYLAQLAEIRAREHPECAFVECNHIQADAHAEEVSRQLSIPCLPMTIEQIGGKPSRIPKAVRTVLVTGFHYGELKDLDSSNRFNMHSVPIEVSAELSQRISKRQKTVVFEAEESKAQHMAEDIERLSDSRVCRLEVTSDINADLAKTFRGKKVAKNFFAYLSPRLWGQAELEWRNHPQVRLIEFRIADSAWPSIADAIALPLGTIPGART